MYLIIFCVLLGLSLILVTLGLFKPEHTELSIVGFVFMFLLAMVLLNGGIEYPTGTLTYSNFSYTQNIDNLTLLTNSSELVITQYAPVVYHGILQHVIGLWLAIMSIAGFVGSLLALKRAW